MTTTRPHHASPWVIDTRALGRRPGTLKRVAVAAPARAPIGLQIIAVPAGAEVDLDLRLEAVAEGVLVSGWATAIAAGECSRCLAEVLAPIRAELCELYAYPDSTTAATTDDDEIPRLVDDLLDLEPLVTDEIVLALPLAPLCRPDCGGLCSECGVRLDDVESGHSHEILDSRWAALQGILGGAEMVAAPPGDGTDSFPVNGSRNPGVVDGGVDSTEQE